MKVVILAGGLGTRLSEETHARPKPMIEIGGKPILWHIMKHYSYYGHNEFIICTGYKGHMIKEYFANYALHMSDIIVDTSSSAIITKNKNIDPWIITIVNTGENTLTGGRLLRIKEYLDDKPFMLTYGDGVSDINIDALIKTHYQNKRTVTITAVKPALRFGTLEIDGDHNVTSFKEKPEGDGKYISGGFMVCEPSLLDHIEGDKTALEQTPLNKLAEQHHITAYKHHGFWYAMDTLRDKNHLETLWQSGNAPWKVWN